MSKRLHWSKRIVSFISGFLYLSSIFGLLGSIAKHEFPVWGFLFVLPLVIVGLISLSITIDD